MKAKIAERGQVTIPKPLREKLGLRPGAQLDFSVEAGRLVAVKAGGTDPVGQVIGCLKMDKTTEAFLEEVRGKA
ncbi:MAG: AbrB/MazE/SpoVT family DNA-binding domain-containing protein [Pseudomonadota bacterium]